MTRIFDLTGRTAIVTGGARGLGKAMARGLATAGAAVALVDIDEEAAARTSEAFRIDGFDCRHVGVDVTSVESVDAMVRTLLDPWDSIDVLINNAGICRTAAAEAMTLDDWNIVLAVNLTGVFLCAQRVGREMIRQGDGNIINISSMSSLIANYPQPQIAYNASKAGVNMLTKSLASEWAQYGVRVNAIAPGYMKTDLTKRFFEDPEAQALWDTERNWIAPTPQRRVGLPEDLEGAVVYLASDASGFMTGHVLVIDGGYTIR